MLSTMVFFGWWVGLRKGWRDGWRDGFKGWFHYYKRYDNNDVGKGGVRVYEAYEVK